MSFGLFAACGDPPSPFLLSYYPTSYSLPTFADFPSESKGFCTLKKIPLFLFKTGAQHFLGRVGRDESEDHMEELPSPLQCSVKMKMTGSDPTLMNILDCQIFPLGHQYRMIIGSVPKDYRGVAFLPLIDQGGGREFVVLLNYTRLVLVLRSAEMRWTRLKKISEVSCHSLVAFRGRFYAIFLDMDLFVIDPYSLEETPLMPSPPVNSWKYLVPSGDDELFLVEVILPSIFDLSRLACRVCRLDEEAGEWVEVSDLGDRVLFIGDLGNVSCSAMELPDGYGVSGNSILITHMPGNVTYFYKFGSVHTARPQDDLNRWMTILSTSPIVALRVDGSNL